jgi:hypothetical protein
MSVIKKLYKKTKQVYFEGYFVAFQDYYEEKFDDDLVVRDYSIEKILEKVKQQSDEEGILEIYQIDLINQEVETIKVIEIFNELHLCNDFHYDTH